VRAQVVLALALAGCGGGPFRAAGTCDTAVHCDDDPAKPFCVDQLCVACESGDTCGPEAPRCTTPDYACGACVGDVDCTRHELTTRCASDGTCVGCLDDTQCAAIAPVCDGETRACRGCLVDDECPSAVCEPTTGTCIAESMVLYASTTGTGQATCAMTEPCTLATAIGKLDGAHRYIRLAAGTYDVDADVSNRTGSIHGSGATITGGITANDLADVMLRGVATSSIAMRSTVGVPKIVLEDGSIGTIDARPGNVTVRRSTIAPVGGNRALHAQNEGARGSVVTIERSRISGGDGFCVLDTSQLAISNSTIANLEPGSTLLPCNSIATVAGPLTFTHVTMHQAPIACGDNASVAVRILNSIAIPAPVGGRCQVEFSLTSGDPGYVSAATGDFHLTSGSPAIDAGDPTTTPIPDLEGTERPQGSAVDLGALEFKTTP